MMAAAQPFLSGAISKTVNMPRDTTPADIADAYSGRLAAGAQGAGHLSRRLEGKPAAFDQHRRRQGGRQSRSPRRAANDCPTRASRSRTSSTWPGTKGYITVGLYDDGRPGELFITMAKEGSTIGGLMDCFGTAVSMSLQYGVPLEVYVNKFSHTRFEPMGHTKNPDIPHRQEHRGLHLPLAGDHVPARLSRGEPRVIRTQRTGKFATGRKGRGRCLRAQARRHEGWRADQ